MRFVEDGVGLAILAIEVAIAMLLFSAEGMSLTAWVGLYFILAAVGVACWHSEKAPQSSVGWLKMIAGSLILGIIFFAGDIVVGHLRRPSLPLIEAAKEAPFGFFLTLAASLVVIAITVAGLVRIVFRTKLMPRSSASR